MNEIITHVFRVGSRATEEEADSRAKGSDPMTLMFAKTISLESPEILLPTFTVH